MRCSTSSNPLVRASRPSIRDSTSPSRSPIEFAFWSTALSDLPTWPSFELRVETWVSMALSAPRSSRAVSISLWRSSTWRCAFPPPPIHLNTSIMWSLP